VTSDMVEAEKRRDGRKGEDGSGSGWVVKREEEGSKREDDSMRSSKSRRVLPSKSAAIYLVE